MKDKIKEAYANSQKAAPNEESELNLDDHKKMHVFVETSSVYSVRQNYFNDAKDNDSVVLGKIENHNIPNLYKVDLDASKTVQAGDYIQKDGLVLHVCICDDQTIGKLEEQDPTLKKLRATVVQQYIDIYNQLCNRVYVNLCEFLDVHINQKEWQENRMGVQEFNYLDSYEEIAQKVVKYYNAYPGNQRQIEWHQVQFFNGEFNIVSYYDYNIMATIN